MTASTIDAETLRRATLAAERLYSTSTDEDVQLLAGVFIQLLTTPGFTRHADRVDVTVHLGPPTE
jgi:hypothetical protein